MKIETALFGAGVFFFAPIAIIYGIVTSWNEPVGTSALFLTAGLAALIALYFWLTSRRIDPRPEDDPMGQIADSAGRRPVLSPVEQKSTELVRGADGAHGTAGIH